MLRWTLFVDNSKSKGVLSWETMKTKQRLCSRISRRVRVRNNTYYTELLPSRERLFDGIYISFLKTIRLCIGIAVVCSTGSFNFSFKIMGEGKSFCVCAGCFVHDFGIWFLLSLSLVIRSLIQFIREDNSFLFVFRGKS